MLKPNNEFQKVISSEFLQKLQDQLKGQLDKAKTIVLPDDGELTNPNIESLMAAGQLYYILTGHRTKADLRHQTVMYIYRAAAGGLDLVFEICLLDTASPIQVTHSKIWSYADEAIFYFKTEAADHFGDYDIYNPVVQISLCKFSLETCKERVVSSFGEPARDTREAGAKQILGVVLATSASKSFSSDTFVALIYVRGTELTLSIRNMHKFECELMSVSRLLRSSRAFQVVLNQESSKASSNRSEILQLGIGDDHG